MAKGDTTALAGLIVCIVLFAGFSAGGVYFYRKVESRSEGGGEPGYREQLAEVEKKLADWRKKLVAEEEKVTVFMCTHDLSLAEGICDTFGFIAEGKLLRQGTREALIDATWKERNVRIRTLEGAHTLPFGKEGEIDALVRRVMDSGERVVEVTSDRPSLEEIYFETVGSASSGSDAP